MQHTSDNNKATTWQSKKEFSDELARLRKEHRYSLRQLADKVEVTASYLSGLERGMNKPPSEAVLRKLARTFMDSEDRIIFLAGRIPSDLTDILKTDILRYAKILRRFSEMSCEEQDEFIKLVLEMSQSLPVNQ